MDQVTTFLRNEEGQGFLEYGLLISLTAIVVIGALTILGQRVIPYLEVDIPTSTTH